MLHGETNTGMGLFLCEWGLAYTFTNFFFLADRHHLTFVGATRGDAGSAAMYGLRGKRDISVVVMFPEGQIAPVQEAQITTVPDENISSLAVDGTFEDCQVCCHAVPVPA
jgi:threonine synthase